MIDKKLLTSILLLISLSIIGQPTIMVQDCFGGNNKHKQRTERICKTVQSQKVNILKKIRRYNKVADTALADDIYAILDSFNLNEHSDILVSQLCLESQGKHKQNGKIRRSTHRALGIGQIIPQTAFHYLRNKASKKDLEVIKSLNVTSFKFIYKVKNPYKPNPMVDRLMVKWLSNKHNNLVIWAFIMKKNIEEKGGLKRALIAYNGKPNSEYVKKIYRINRF